MTKEQRSTLIALGWDPVETPESELTVSEAGRVEFPDGDDGWVLVDLDGSVDHG